MSVRHPSAAAPRAPAPSYDRLAAVLAAGLAQLDIGVKSSRKGPAAAAAAGGGGDGRDGPDDERDRQRARELAATRDNLLRSLVKQYQRSADMDRINVVQKLANEGYLKVTAKGLVRTYMKVDDYWKWQPKTGKEEGKWVKNERDGKRMLWIEIAVELEDKNAPQHGKAMRAMSYKRAEMVEQKFGPLPPWTKELQKRAEAKRTQAEDGLDDDPDQEIFEPDENPFEDPEAKDSGTWDKNMPRGSNDDWLSDDD